MKTHKLLVILSALCAVISLKAQPAAGHYNELDNKSGVNLFDAISTCANKGYQSLGYDGLLEAYNQTDVDSDGKLIDMYGGCSFNEGDKCGNYSKECDCFNREHSLPKSWWGGNPEKTQQGCDIFHVVPTDGYVNNRRGNYAFGEVGTVTYTYNGNKLGVSKISGYSGTVFEPQDEYKGDLARGYMGTIAKWKLNCNQGNGAAIFNATYTDAGNYGLTDYGIELLMSWHRQDPVSDKERSRNNAIEATQGNRNPFIDYPDLAEYLWGTKKGQTVSLEDLASAYEDTPLTEPTLTSPTVAKIDFGIVKSEDVATESFTLKGVLLTNDITLSISGTDAYLFTVSPSVVTAEQANAGYNVALIYQPEETGVHNATLTISSDDFEDKVIAITAQAKGEEIIDIPDGDYEKVIEVPDEWDGIYLIVNEDNSVVLDGSKAAESSPDRAVLEVTISDEHTIASVQSIDAAAFTISALEGSDGVVITSQDGYTYGLTQDKNSLSVSNIEILTNTITIANGNAIIISPASTTRQLSYNPAGLFRYYSNQNSIQLYRKVESQGGTETSLKNLQDADADIEIYNLFGQKLLQQKATDDILLPRGLYIIRQANNNRKILIR